MKRLALPIFALLAIYGVAQAAGIEVPAERRFHAFASDVPACGDAGVLARIISRFEQKESEYWRSALQIGSFDRVRQISLRGNGLAYIPRRYCAARARMSDGRRREVVYAIGENLGIIGWDYGVEFCVVGLDRNFAYAPGCRAVEPFASRNLRAAALRARY